LNSKALLAFQQYCHPIAHKPQSGGGIKNYHFSKKANTNAT